MKQTCKRCNREQNIKMNDQLCNRCHDVLEFGYPSFEAYPLKENKQKELVLLNDK